MNTNTNTRACTDRHASIDELDRSIVNLAVQLNRITHDFLVLIRRFDERAGWLQWSCESCAEWLHYRCDISKSAAREKVRVAHAIKTLPAIAVAFAEGSSPIPRCGRSLVWRRLRTRTSCWRLP